MKVKWYGAIFSILIFVACGDGLDSTQEGKQRIQALESIKAARSDYAKWKKSSEYAPFERYDKKYNWDAQYEAAIAEITAIRQLLKEASKLKDPDSKKKKMDLFNTRLSSAIEKSKATRQHIKRLRQLKTNPDSQMLAAENQIAEINTIPPKTKPVVDKALEDVRRFEWDKETDLTQRLRQLEEKASSSATALGIAKEQAGSNDPDYGVMADNLNAIEQNLAEMKKADAHLRKQIDEMYRSYSKRLVDMKNGFQITVGRTSWNSYSDYNTERNYNFSPNSVDKAAFDYYATQTGDIAAGRHRSYGSPMLKELQKGRRPDWIRVYGSEEMWNKLGINEIADELIPSEHDEVVFWIQSMDVKHYHRYSVTENGETREGEWEAVDEKLFADNINYLGMDIISKPYGLYESDVIKNPSPPGMAYVGNKKYGEWKKDSSGNSFWSFYGKYMFLNAMLGGNRYYHNDWNHWRRDYRGSRPYYGKNRDGSAIYGTSGTVVRNSPGYKSRSFTKQGGLKTAQASVRSAAGGVRGRGPGGRGK